MPDTAYERIVDVLRGQGRVVKADNGKALAQCPAHDDNNPSLSIDGRRDGKGIVVKCHAGCETTEVVAAIGWTMADLFDEPKVRDIFSPRRDYHYPGGRRVHRKPGKNFPQSGNKDTDRSLFGSDKITDTTTTVYVVEGEKDVEAVQAAGGVAVCSAMGAGKAHLADWSALDGKNVIVVADRDEPGRKHAVEVLGSVLLGAASVKMVEAKAPGKDFADHFAAGYGLEDLVDPLPIEKKPSERNDTTKSSEDDVVDQGNKLSPTDDEEKQPRKSVAAQLVESGRADYVLGITDADEPYGVRADAPHLALMLRGGKSGLRAELSRRFFTGTGVVASQQALADACMVLEGYAAQENPRRVHLRVAEHHGAVYVDTGDTEGMVIELSDGTWKLTDTAPVLFRRTKLTGPMPTPSRQGNLARLWEFVCVDDADRPLILAWLVAALVQVDVPHPILVMVAEQGAAKSSITRVLVALVDPSPVPLRKAPRDADTWITSAAASWVVALDNLSGALPPWLSDSLCRASTGDGDVRRALYTDSDVSVQQFRRCVLLNGVDLAIGQGDLAERVVVVDLKRPEARRREDELAQAWRDAHPVVLGGLLDLAAKVLHRLPGITVDDMPRMADFAAVLAAVDEVLGTAGLVRYRERSKRVAADTLDEPFIGALVARKLDVADKTSAEILAALAPADKPKEWPKNARAVTGQLTRHAPALRAQGWHIGDDGGQNHDKVRKWTITPPEAAPKPPEAVPETDPQGPQGPQPQVSNENPCGSAENGSPAGLWEDPHAGQRGSPAGQADSGNPQQYRPSTCDDGSAGHAGQETGSPLVFCRYCDTELPEHMPSQRQRGYCSRASCGNREKDRQITEAGRR